MGRLRYDIDFDLFGVEKYSAYVHLDKEYVQCWIRYDIERKLRSFDNKKIIQHSCISHNARIVRVSKNA